MRALERGELAADDAGLVAAPRRLPRLPRLRAGLSVGRGLRPRHSRPPASSCFAAPRAPAARARAVLGVFRREWLWRPLFTLSRLLRAHRAPAAARGRRAARIRRWGCWRRRGRRGRADGAREARSHGGRHRRRHRPRPPSPSSAAASWTRSSATSTTPPAARSRPTAIAWSRSQGQACCGALHEHAGDRAARRGAGARRTSRRCADAADYVVVNSAGCGALLKDYGHLLGTDGGGASSPPRCATSPSSSPRRGPRPGGAAAARRGLRRALPPAARAAGARGAARGARARFPASGSGCCPARTSAAAARASTRSLRPAMARAVLDLKIESFAAARAGARDRGDRKSRLPDADRRRAPRGGAADPGGASGGAAG